MEMMVVRGFQLGYVKYIFTELAAQNRGFQIRNGYVRNVTRPLCSKSLSTSINDNNEDSIGSGQKILKMKPNQNVQPENIESSSKAKVYYFRKPKKFLTTDAENFMRSLHQAYPQLVDSDNEKLIKYLEYMSSFGFQISKAAEMAVKYPPVVDNYEKWLMESLQALRLLGLSERQQKKMLARYPELLTFPRKVISSRSEFLRNYFTGDEILTLIENNLSVISEDRNIVKRKLNYLIKCASHTSEAVSKSAAMTHPLPFIKTRHEFLIRAGFFEVIPYQKFFKVMEKINHKVSTAPGGKKFRERYFNPTEVVCMSDEIFIKICTNNLLTVNELAAFEEAYVLETENDFDEESDYDSTESEEDENDEAENNELLYSLHNSTGNFTHLENKEFYY